MRRFSRLAVGIAAAALLVAAAGTYALASSSGGKITVCISKKNGALYKAKKCAKADHELTWGRQGPAGPAGQPGPEGPRGIQGQPGGQGQRGIQGDPGISNYQVVSGTPVQSSGGGINLDSAFAYCPPGTDPLGGGFSSSGENNTLYTREDRPIGSNPGAWYVQTTSKTEAVYTITPYAVCASVSS